MGCAAELSGDVTLLLRQSAKPIGVGPDLVDVEIGFEVQRPQQFTHPLEHGSEIGGFLVLRIGAFADVDVEPIARKPLLASDRPPANQSLASTALTMIAVTSGSLRRMRAVRSETAAAMSAFVEGVGCGVQ